jgi:hypothetical protein
LSKKRMNVDAMSTTTLGNVAEEMSFNFCTTTKFLKETNMVQNRL